SGWPGTVRQLLHVLQNACLLSSAEVLDVGDFTLEEDRGTTPPPGEAIGDEDLDLRRNLERVERDLIQRALKLAEGNRAQAARLLGIRRALLYARMNHLKIDDR
ncbi:MAG: helix-turn-helix domain-containing protein, partial [Polyangiaceae bacterium]